MCIAQTGAFAMNDNEFPAGWDDEDAEAEAGFTYPAGDP